MSGQLHCFRAEPADRDRWDAFVAARAEADFLQSWAWGEVTAEAGERPIRWIATAAEEVRGLAQVLVRPAGFGRSILYAPHGPVWHREAPDADRVLGQLIDVLHGAARAVGGIVVKLDPRAEPGAANGERIALALEARGLRRARHDLQAPTTRLVDLLDGSEELRRTWDKDARNLVRRARREGVSTSVDRVGAATEIAAFHELLASTGERAEFRVRSRASLERLAAELPPSGGWYLALASFEGRPIAGMLTPRVGDRAYYLYGASLREPELKHKNGSYAAMAAATEVLAADGVRTLDLWGVVEPDDPTADPEWEGFSAFKRQFGGVPVRHPGTFDLVTSPLWYGIRDTRERLRERLGR